REIAQKLGSHLEPIHLPRTCQHETEIILDNSQAQQHLGWQAEVFLDEGLELTIARMREKQPQVLSPQTVHMPTVRTTEELVSAARTTEELTPTMRTTEELAPARETTLTHA